MVFSPALSSALTCVCYLRLKGNPLQIFLFLQLFPLWYLYYKLASLVYPNSQLFLKSRRLIAPPSAAAWNSLRTVCWFSHRTHLTCFPSLKNHFPLLSDIQCLENHCFVYFPQCFSSFRWKGNLSGLCYLS